MNCIELLLTKNCRRGDCRRYTDTGDSESRGAARGLPAGSTFAVCATVAPKNDQRNGRESFDGFVCSRSRVGTSIWLYNGLMIQCFRWKIITKNSYHKILRFTPRTNAWKFVWNQKCYLDKLWFWGENAWFRVRSLAI